MGRGVSAGGGQSSLGYLFGGGEAPSPQAQQTNRVNQPSAINSGVAQRAHGENSKKVPAAGVSGYATNNYIRSDGQNCGNFITDRPSTKVHAAPGGSSSLNYLFGDGK